MEDKSEADLEVMTCDERAAFLIAKNKAEQDERFNRMLNRAQIDEDLEMERRLDREIFHDRPSIWDDLGDFWLYLCFRLHGMIWGNRIRDKELRRAERKCEMIREKEGKKRWRELHNKGLD